MKHSALWVSLVSAFIFWACLGDKSSVEYHTRYQVDLASIDNRLTLDSATFVVSVDGVIQDSRSFSAQDLADRLVSLPTLVGAEGDSIRIVYTVWSQGKVVAQGADAFMVSDAANATKGTMVLDDGNIALLIEVMAPAGSSSSALSGSSAVGGSSAASSSSSVPVVVASCGSDAHFNIGFLANTATLAEGDTVIRLLLGGAKGARLATPQTVTLQVSQGSDDVSVKNATVTLLANDSVCSVYEVPVNVIQDLLVEGAETATVQIVGFSSGLSAGVYQSLPLTLLDKDSAWVSLAFPESVTETDGAQSVAGIATLHTSGEAKLARAASFSLTTLTGTTLPTSAFVLGSGYQFGAQSKNGATANVGWTLKGDYVWSDDRTLILQANGTALAAPPSGSEASMAVVNDDMEYIVLQTGSVDYVWLDPQGHWKIHYSSAAMTVESGSTLAGGYSVITSLGTDTLFTQDAYKDHAIVSFVGSTPTIRTMQTTNTGIMDADSWNGTDANGCHVIVSVGTYTTLETYCPASNTFVQGSNYNMDCYAVAVDPASTASAPAFYTLKSNGLYYNDWSGSDQVKTVRDSRSYSFGDDIAISPAGRRLISRNGALDLDGVALSVAGWLAGPQVKLLATPRETFWMFTAVANGLTATEISTSGKILRGPSLVDDNGSSINVMPMSVTLLRSDKSF